MKGDLLWVYEGLTDYLGTVLTARSGLLTAEQSRDRIALTASTLEHLPGRLWRSLQNTANAAQILYFSVPDIQAAHQKLVDAGVSIFEVPRIVAPMPDHDLWMSFFRDTEGNVMALMSEVPRKS